ncbi:MAG: hypothetical protein HY976_02910, partial [Candidatus Kerfeldbacteria bacterium]|nr:hypothetical protein [Candidatus Kerfeldbacteria bacterium]
MPSASAIRYGGLHLEPGDHTVHCGGERPQSVMMRLQNQHEVCDRLLLKGGAIKCRCGTPHALINLVALATEGNPHLYERAKKQLQHHYWELRTLQVADQLYRGRAYPMFFRASLPWWLTSIFDMVEQHGFRPAFIPGELGGDWVLFELDPEQHWKDWGFTGERCGDPQDIRDAIHLVAQRLAFPQDRFHPIDLNHEWSVIREWRRAWRMAEGLTGDLPWDHVDHWLRYGP